MLSVEIGVSSGLQSEGLPANGGLLIVGAVYFACQHCFSALPLCHLLKLKGHRQDWAVHVLFCLTIWLLLSAQVGVTVLSPHATIFSEHDRQQVKTAREHRKERCFR